MDEFMYRLICFVVGIIFGALIVWISMKKINETQVLENPIEETYEDDSTNVLLDYEPDYEGLKIEEKEEK